MRWDIVEEHMEEAAFLWGQRELARVACDYVLPEKDKHKINKKTFEDIQGALTSLEDTFRDKLKSRKTSLDQWNKRNDPSQHKWHTPYMMAKTSNPLAG